MSADDRIQGALGFRKDVEKITVRVGPKISINLNPVILLRPTHQNGMGTIVHISGDLYVFMYHLSATGVVSAYLINGEGLSKQGLMNIMLKCRTLRELVLSLGNRIPKAFYCMQGKWKELKLPTI